MRMSPNEATAGEGWIRWRRAALVKRVSSAIFQPRGPEAGEIRLNHRRVFVLPTRSGLALGAMLVALLLGSINYTLSLGFALTFLVAGIAWIGMFYAFRNLAHLSLRPARVEPVYAGEVAEFCVVLSNRQSFDRYAISLQADRGLAPILIDPVAHTETRVNVPVRITQRGWQPMPAITFRTTFPLGLWRVWSYWQPDLQVLAYPRPAPPGEPLPPLQTDGSEGQGHAGLGSEDYAGIRTYLAGDPIRHLAWKAMARTPSGKNLTKIFDGSSRRNLWLDLAQLPAAVEPEAALSRLVRWVLDCEAGEIQYGLRLLTLEIEPDRGATHRDRCLTALALFGSTHDAS